MNDKMNFIMEIKATCQLPFVAGVHTKERSNQGKTIVTKMKSNDIIYPLWYFLPRAMALAGSLSTKTGLL